ncbi:MocR-like pyridoxine biosynthesis transcription factor PdxR [Occultella gossypii]|uniref:PLP-dependent aminotransferase family protein n=1 Tax=Occultella gossypii TaxID=2800820 RepID=A0ABS7SD20_9MICO|nr:PLP-dependent aminotransferase family protein [Occultella gossypii]MBZ2198255.1 PLP-dependent aminotransferase family protein [Occultella gossypii]
MELHISLEGHPTVVGAIYRGVLEAIRDGRIPGGRRLPPTRQLALNLGVSRNSVASAYERLTAEGYLEARVGSGTYVRAAPPPPTAVAPRRPADGLRPLAVWSRMPAGMPPAGSNPRFDFSVGMPDGELFPLATWRRLLSRELRVTNLDLGRYAAPSGVRPLRAAIARHVGASRAVRATADDVMVTNGAQQALDLIGRVMVGPGDVVAVEEPGYPPARRVFEACGAHVIGVRVDGEGLMVDALPARARLVYVTPSHQFPLGAVMSLARRRALLLWAREADALIVEDDYDSEYRYAARPLDPLQSLDPDGHTVYVGSFSKTLSPALRLGFLVAPQALRGPLRVARSLTDWHGNPITELALARFIEDGDLAAHLRRTARVYAARRAALLGALTDWPPGRLAVIPSVAGLHVAARLGTGLYAPTVAARARAAGIAVRPISHFAADPATPDGIVLGYGAIDVERIGPGLERLARVIDDSAGS